jgi:hypothetical protein
MYLALYFGSYTWIMRLCLILHTIGNSYSTLIRSRMLRNVVIQSLLIVDALDHAVVLRLRTVHFYFLSLRLRGILHFLVLRLGLVRVMSKRLRRLVLVDCGVLVRCLALKIV